MSEQGTGVLTTLRTHRSLHLARSLSGLSSLDKESSPEEKSYPAWVIAKRTKWRERGLLERGAKGKKAAVISRTFPTLEMGHYCQRPSSSCEYSFPGTQAGSSLTYLLSGNHRLKKCFLWFFTESLPTCNLIPRCVSKFSPAKYCSKAQ